MLNVGLIGCGGISRGHANGWLEIGDKATVTAVADVSADNARQRAEQLGGTPEVFSDYRQLLTSTDVQAVDICLPHHLHADAIIAAAEAGKHVLCEKPLCISMDEAKKVSDAIAAGGITLMCAHNQLYMPPVAKAREMITSGELGKVYEIRTTDCFLNRGLSRDMGWRGDLATAGGGELIDTGYHPTYLLLHLATAEPVEVTAMVSRHRLSLEGEDSAQVLVRFADGSVGNIVTSWAYQLPATSERISVVAENGTLWSDGRTLSYRTDGVTTTYEFAQVNGFAAEIEDFVDRLADGRRPLNSEVEGTHVLQVILGAYASVERSAVVRLADL